MSDSSTYSGGLWFIIFQSQSIAKSGLGLSRPAMIQEGGETVNGTNELCRVSASRIEGLADETIQCETRRIPAAGTQSVANQARCGLIVK
jgi:hypothetical protein